VFDLHGAAKARASPWSLLHEALGVWSTASEYRERHMRGTIYNRQRARLDASL
jgi:hypothetical protein